MSDRTIAIAINVYVEPIGQLTACLSRIARHFPQALVTAFINGHDRPDLIHVAEQHNTTVVTGDNLARNDTWHLWWLRMLQSFRASHADLCFKFDPDTMVDAVPTCFPDADYFGSVWVSRRYGIPFVQGGITGLSKCAVRRLLASGLLTPTPPTIPIIEGAWKNFADDQHLAVALAKLGISPTEWPECYSQWKTPVSNECRKHAIVHPRYHG
jgi:hypothetical protein